MSNLYKGTSKNASHQVSVHLEKWFQRKLLFRNWPIRKKNCLWRPYLLTDLDEITHLFRGPSIYGSYQVSVHLAEGIQMRRLKCEKLTDDRRWTPSDSKSSPCLWQGELKNSWNHLNNWKQSSLKIKTSKYISNLCMLCFFFTHCSILLIQVCCTKY